MPIAVTCECGKNLRLKDELAGRRIRCPACQAVFRVPLSATKAAALAAAKAGKPPPAPLEEDDMPPVKSAVSEWDEDAPRTRPKPKPKPAKKSRMLLWLVILGGVGFLAVGGAAAYVVLMTDLIIPKKIGPIQPGGGGGGQKVDEDTKPPVEIAEPLFKRQVKGITNMALSPDAKWLAVSHDNGIYLLNAADGKEHADWPKGDLTSVPRLLFSPDSKALILNIGVGPVKRRGVPDGNLEPDYDEGFLTQRHLAFLKDGALVGIFTKDDKELVIKDLTANKVLAQFKPDLSPAKFYKWSVAPDGKRAVTIDDNLRLVLVDWSSQPPTVKVLDERAKDNQFGAFRATAANLTDDVVAVTAVGGIKGKTELKLWDLKAGAATATVELSNTDALEHLAMTPDGKWLIAATGADPKEIHVYNAAKGNKVAVLKGATEQVRQLALAPDLTRVAALDFGGHVYLWDLTKAELNKKQ
jgi:hypothetical protein